MARKTNITLIGMPGSGKSTLGPLLAKRCGLKFIDTDTLIEQQQGQPLQQLLNALGYLGLRELEAQTLLDLDVRETVIATGGSAVYSSSAMAHLQSISRVVFLQVGLTTIHLRINDFSTRGLARDPDQSFANMFDERQALYRQYADVTVPCDGLNQEQVLTKLLALTNKN